MIKTILVARTLFIILFIINNLSGQEVVKIIKSRNVMTHAEPNGDEGLVERSWLVTIKDYLKIEECNTESCKDSILNKYTLRSRNLYSEKLSGKMVPLNSCLIVEYNNVVFENSYPNITYSLERRNFYRDSIEKLKIYSNCHQIDFNSILIYLYYGQTEIASYEVKSFEELPASFYTDLEYSHYIQFGFKHYDYIVMSNKFHLGFLSLPEDAYRYDFGK